MRIFRQTSTVLAAGALIVALASCAEPTTAPVAAAPSLSISTYASSEGTLMSCSARDAKTFSVTIDQRGARYAKHGIEVVVPPGALAGPQRFVITIPRSRYVEADIHAVGHDRFTFARPVTVTFDYARCGNVQGDAPALDVWYIDNGTKALLEPMPTRDDRQRRTITFQTTHLSGYGVVYRTPPAGNDSTGGN